MLRFVILFSCLTVCAGYGAALTWKPLVLRSENQVLCEAPGGGGGAVVQALAWNPRKKLNVLAGTGFNGVWCSTNGGASFTPAKGMLLSDIKDIHFSLWREDLVYALAAAAEEASYNATRREGLWRSCDGGKNWEFLVQAPLEGGVWGSMIACCENGGRKATAVGTHGRGILVHSTETNSWNWRKCGRRGWIAGITAVKDVFLAAADEGVFRSDDGGDTFKPVAGLASVQFLSPQGAVFAVGGGSPPAVFLSWPENGVYCSRDLGLTWLPAAGTDAPSDRFFASLYTKNNKTEAPVVGFLKHPGKRVRDSILLSYDRGKSWNTAENIEGRGRFRRPTRFCCESLVFHPDMAEIMLAGIDREIMKSPDGGVTWDAWGAGLYGWGCSGSHFSARVPLKSNCFYLALQEAGLWYTGNGGKSFRPVLEDAGQCASVACHPDPESGLVLSWWKDRGEWILKKSMDSGSSWDVVLTADAGPASFLFHPLKPERFFAGCFMTTDGGGSFKRLEVDPLAVFRRTGKVMYGVKNRNSADIVVSGSGGMTGWKKVLDDKKQWTGVPLCAAVHPDYADTLFLGTTNGLFVLSGDRFRRCSAEGLPANAWITAIHTATGNSRILVASVKEAWLRRGGLMVSRDKGETWSYFRKGFPVLGLCPFGMNRFLAAADTGLFIVTVSGGKELRNGED